MKRRQVLQGMGVVGVAALGGVVYRAYDRGVFSVGVGEAYAPWTTWAEDARDGTLSFVRAGILAASPHNTQPWLFRVSDERIEVYADTRRDLGTFDPFLREMTLGIGCAIENICLAAREVGQTPSVVCFEGALGGSETREPHMHLATITFTEGKPERSPHFDAIACRHTDRAPYDTSRPLPAELEAAWRALAREHSDVMLSMITEDAEKVRLGRLVVSATEAIVADGPMVRDSEEWFRFSIEELRTHRDGPTLDAAGLPPLVAAMAKILPKTSPEENHRFWLEATRDVHVATASAFGVISVRDRYERAQNLRAGQLWQRLHLDGTVRGLAMQPLNQPVERIDRERQLGRSPRAASAIAPLLANDGWQPTFVFRVGHPTRVARPSPRRSIESVLL